MGWAGSPKGLYFPLDAVQAGISPKPRSNSVFQRPQPRLSVIFPTVFFWCNDNMAKHDIATVRIQTLGLEIVVQPCGVRLGHTDQNSLSEKTAPSASGCLQLEIE